uniref:LAGLIDADG homing endonuclease n=1 Tax=Daedalea confragosa TaxID=2028083 RepID=UPI002A838E4F|nr:LAGLIDADG homing endonuclease [Daedaleopsis confragosa]WNZ34375.1 LAGLIDADG homing endonuclease [Daedaleopsis confragosa]
MKPQIYNICLLFSLVLIVPLYFDITSKVSRLKGILRIGPHNKDVYSIIFGSLLGDAHAEKRAAGLGTRIIFIKKLFMLNIFIFYTNFYLILVIVILKYLLSQADYLPKVN